MSDFQIFVLIGLSIIIFELFGLNYKQKQTKEELENIGVTIKDIEERLDRISDAIENNERR